MLRLARRNINRRGASHFFRISHTSKLMTLVPGDNLFSVEQRTFNPKIPGSSPSYGRETRCGSRKSGVRPLCDTVI